MKFTIYALDELKIHHRISLIQNNFEAGFLFMESHPKNPEFRNTPEHIYINLHKRMGQGRDQTRDPWICSQTRILLPDTLLTALRDPV